MNKTILIAFLLTAFTHPSFAQQTTEKFMKACDSGGELEKVGCHFYLLGLVHSARFFNEVYPQLTPNAPRLICIPNGTSQTVAVNKILEHIRQNPPENYSHQITEDAFIALKETYGCNP